MSVNWQDPPSEKGNTKWRKFRQELMAHPNKWALLPVPYKSGSGAALYRRWPGRWESTSRTRSDGLYDIYIRYLGEEE